MSAPATPRRPAAPRVRRMLGLTLIEVMVALAVFAVLGTLTYRGTTQLIIAQQRLDGELERWREIGRALQIVESELLQVAAPQPVAGSARPPALLYLPGASTSELRILALSGQAGPERVGFRLRDGRLEWLRRPEGAPEAQDERDVLLDRVSAARWRFLTDAGWSERWPPAVQTERPLPGAIELQLDLADTGTVTRLYALR